VAVNVRRNMCLERNHNIDFRLVFWPKQIHMDSFLVQKPNYGAAFAYCPVRWGTDFVPNYIILVFEYGTVFPCCGGDALSGTNLITIASNNPVKPRRFLELYSQT
jgi:hypothetical protein